MTTATERAPRSLLITGGCGFIGSAMIRYLLGGNLVGGAPFDGSVVNLDALTYAAMPDSLAAVEQDPRYHFVHGDIRDRERVGALCDEHAIDAILHFAAESHVDRSIAGPGAFVHTNIVGTYELLEVVRARPHIHFHHVSTDEVFGSLGDTGAFHEGSPYAPNSPYAASKAASDHLLRAYAHTYGLSTTVSNCSNNYGPFQFPEKLVPLMLLHMLEGKPLPIYGDGSNVRDWLYVDDHAEALWRILTGGRAGETYNVGGSAERSNLALIHALIEQVGALADKEVEALKALITFVPDRAGHDQRYAVDCRKLRDELGWSPAHDLEAGLRATVAWYLSADEWLERARSGDYAAWVQQNYADRG
jgi:dTDP-glucose 4,6-dehydratase